MLITGRIHPSETTSSWIIQGIIDFLMSETLEARRLRDQFVIKIIPMMNPEGVIVGNFRTDLVGNDLNRTFNENHEVFQPQMKQLRTLVLQAKEKYRRENIYFLDIRGTSSRKNCFFLGPEFRDDDLRNYLTKLVVLKMRDLAPSFRAQSSRFKEPSHLKFTPRIRLKKKVI